MQIQIFASDENQTIYREWVQREQMLGHRQLQYRIDQLEAQIEALKTDKDLLGKTNGCLSNEIRLCAKTTTAHRKAMKLNTKEINALTEQSNQIQNNVTALQVNVVNLKKTIGEQEVRLAKDALSEQNNQHDKILVELRIQQNQKDLENIKREKVGMNQTREQIEQTINHIVAQRHAIVTQSNQNLRLNSKFLSIGERNKAISTEFEKLDKEMKREITNITRFDTMLENDIDALEALKQSHAEESGKLAQINIDMDAEQVVLDLQKQLK